MDIKILSWNIEHFDGVGGRATRGATRGKIIAARQSRMDRVIQTIADAKPDVFGLSEVEGKLVHKKMTRALPGYVFNLTEGRQSQEILIGVRGKFTSFFTQRNEFKRSNPYLRPGALLTLTVNKNTDIVILFVHLKSANSPEGFGLRDAMFDKVFNLRNALNKVARTNGQKASNFIVLGDMNTMGFDYDGRKYDIPGEEEINVVINAFARRKMKWLPKSHNATFSNGSGSKYPDSDLDHVFVADHLVEYFQKASDGSIVDVGGWAKLTKPAERDKWIRDYSDHAPLCFKLCITPNSSGIL